MSETEHDGGRQAYTQMHGDKQKQLTSFINERTIARATQLFYLFYLLFLNQAYSLLSHTQTHTRPHTHRERDLCTQMHRSMQ